MMVASSDFEIITISRTDEELIKFIKLSQQWVIESDKNTVEVELGLHKRRMKHMDYCWIILNDRIVGVVKMGVSIFYSIGLDPCLTQEQSFEIFKLIISDISLTAPLRISSNTNAKFWEMLQGLGFVQEFGREKHALELTKVKKTFNYSDLNLEKLNWRKISKITDLFIDAYKNSIDENIGIFNKPSAIIAIQEIKGGLYGIVIPELSYFVISGKKLIAGIITTINESQLFIVIVGVRVEYQYKGIGKKLLSLVIERGKKMGYLWIKLWVTRENIIAKQMYSSLGFVKISKVIFSSKLKKFNLEKLYT